MTPLSPGAPAPPGALPAAPHWLLRQWIENIGVLALALGVRLVGLGWGLPNARHWYSYHPDESVHQLAGALAHIVLSDFNPHFSNYPSLSIYASYLIYLGMQAAGIARPLGTVPGWVGLHDLILAGRLVSVAGGAAASWFALALARELKLGKWAVLSGLLVALLPGHVQHSHFATVDVPTTAVVLAALWLAARARTRPALLISALVAGLAASTKYNGALVLIAPLIAAAVPGRAADSPPSPAPATPPGAPTPRLARGARSFALPLLLTGAAAAGFFLGSPYALLNPRQFWNEGLAYEVLVHPHEGSGNLFTAAGNPWWYHLTFNLPFVTTWPPLLAGLAGVAFAVRDRRWWPLLGFIAVYFLSLGASQALFMRYTLPLAVALAPFAALAPAHVARRHSRAAIGLAALLLSSSALGTWNVLAPLGSPDPRDQAAAWLRARAPLPGSSPASPIRVGTLQLPWYDTPPLVRADRTQASGRALLNPTDGRFALAVLPLGTAVNSSAALPPWFVLSEFETRERERLDPSHPLAGQLPLRFYLAAVRFKNQSPFALPGRAYVPHDYLYTDPGITIWQRSVSRTAYNPLLQ